MITYGENIKIFCGNSNPEFAKTVCKELGLPLGNSEVKSEHRLRGNKKKKKKM